MLDQLFDIVKNIGQKTVVENPEVPNEYNEDIVADATKTIGSGFQNIMAGGGFENILDLFKGGGGNSANSNSGGGIGGLLKNPIVSMMVGYFISKLVSKYKMSPSAASNVANNLIPSSLNNLIQRTNDPNDNNATLDNLVKSLVGNTDEQEQTGGGGSSQLQNLLEKFTGSGSGGSGGGFNIQDIIGSLTKKAQTSFQNKEQGGGGGLLDLIKGFISK